MIGVLVAFAVTVLVSYLWGDAIDRSLYVAEPTPVIRELPRAHVIGVPTVTRRKHPGVWP